jgi:Cu(I)/Ag(I) efflux system periplasmic protein CusF
MGMLSSMQSDLSRVVTIAAVILSGSLAGCSKEPSPAPAPAPAPAAQASAKKSYAFRGRVEKVDPAAKTLTVNGENVEGWMGPMSMVYGLDKEELLGQISVGDRITATVYDGDYKTLHDVKVAAR